MNVDALLNERERTHGCFQDHATCAQELKHVFNRWECLRGVMLTPTQRESLDMIAHKIGRILAGNPNHVDHWDDIAGYARLISRELTKPTNGDDNG